MAHAVADVKRNVILSPARLSERHKFEDLGYLNRWLRAGYRFKLYETVAVLKSSFSSDPLPGKFLVKWLD